MKKDISQWNHSSSQDLSRVFFPGFCDVHVHLREPGFSYKGTIQSETLAGASGGYTALCAMPNLKPVPDCLDHLKEEEERIKKDALVPVYPYGAVTQGENGEVLSDIEELASRVIAFSDDGHGIQDEEILKRAMVKIKKTGKILACHCEVNSLSQNGYLNDGPYAWAHGHIGIPNASEWKEVERDIKLSYDTGCPLHICHVSTKESCDLIREGKKDGVNVSAETAPHYLLLDEGDLQEDGRFKMNPPLGSCDDRKALIEAIKDGTIDMIVTDHAPHSKEEKSRGLAHSSFGIVGLETAFPLLYTYLVKKEILSLNQLIELMAHQPRIRFGLAFDDAYCLYDLKSPYRIQSEYFHSLGKSTPFDNWEVYGKCLKTVVQGKIVYQAKDPEALK